MEDKDLFNKLKYYSKKKLNINEIMQRLDVSKGVINQFIETHNANLKNDYVFVYDDCIVKYINRYLINKTNIELPTNNYNTMKVCFISDTHLASTFDRLDILNTIYEKCERKGISIVFHCGDLVEGTNTKNLDEKYYKELSYSGQLDYACELYPKYNGKTYIISGNHDMRWFTSSQQLIVKDFVQKRDDFVFLGNEEALVSLGPITILVLHNASRQKIYLDATQLILEGHYHKSIVYEKDNITHIRSAALINNPPYYVAQGFESEKACWFLDIDYSKDGQVYSIRKELDSYEDHKPLTLHI